MSQLRIVLADLPNEIRYPSPVRYRLEELFGEVIKKMAAFKTVKVEYWSLRNRQSKPPHLGSHDFLMYFVRNRDDSVLVTGLGAAAPTGQGQTHWNGQITGSEAYITTPAAKTNESKHGSEFLARLTFHELMHNASHFGDTQLHSMTFYKGKPLSLSKAVIDEKTPLSEGDILFMADHIPMNNRAQWTGGFLHYQDPLRAGLP